MLFVIANKPFEPVTIEYLNVTVSTQKELAVIFSIIIALVMIFYFLSEKVADNRKKKCSSDIWKNTQKLQIYINQEKMAHELYDQYFNGLAGLSMTIVVAFVVALIYPLVFIVFVIYSMVAIVGISLLFESSNFVKEAIEENIAKVFNVVAMFAFLIIFIVVVVDFLSPYPSTKIIFALISLLLLRRMTDSMRAFIQSVKRLYNQREEIITIFLKEHPDSFGFAISHKKKKFWSLFEENAYDVWVPQLMEKILEQKVEIKTIEWFELGVVGEVALKVEIAQKSYLLKIFNSNRHKEALKELILTQNIDSTPFALAFIGESSIEGFSCHLFDLPSYSICLPKEFTLKKQELLNLLAQLPLPDRLQKQYQATHKLLHERIVYDSLERIKIAVKAQQGLESIEEFKKTLPFFINKVEVLPKQLVFSKLLSQNCIVVDGRLKILSFGSWSIEPLGFVFLKNEENSEPLDKIVPKELETNVKILHLLIKYERNYNQNNFKKVIGIIKRLNTLKVNEE
ncbi:MAG: hypothetical protein JXQ76_04160 [Campylobacterales bacterium]|nr:hypothetical protein [Campylobacterales bacterium]